MRTIICLILAPLLCSVDCHPASAETPEVEFVTDLARVAGCQFRGTIKPPTVVLGSRRPDGFENYMSALEREAAQRGATHLYILNRAAGWGGAATFGAAYACRH